MVAVAGDTGDVVVVADIRGDPGLSAAKGENTGEGAGTPGT